MTPLKTLHFLNSCIAGTTGLIFGIILIYLIVKRTAKEMKAYSKMLLQATIIDMIVSTFCIIVDPVRAWTFRFLTSYIPPVNILFFGCRSFKIPSILAPPDSPHQIQRVS